MHDTELADPYMTPRTLQVRRPFRYLAYGLILGVVLLSIAAGSWMVYWAMRPTFSLDRGSAIKNRDLMINQNRGPVKSPSAELPANSTETIVLEAGLGR